jgi:protein-disulfide isomerase
LKANDFESIGGPLLMGAVVLAISLLGAASFLSQSIDRGSYRLGQLALNLEEGSGPSVANGARPQPEVRYAIPLGGAPRRGGKQARVTIVEWSDFQCPFCGKVNATLQQVEAAYGDRVALVFKHLPLPMHPGAPAAHAAAEAAHRQGHFWAMHDKIFANPRDLDAATLARYAGEIGLDIDRFRRDSESEVVRERIRSDAQEAKELGVSGTPSFFVNGRFLSGAQPFVSFKRLIEQELREPR